MSYNFIITSSFMYYRDNQLEIVHFCHYCYFTVHISPLCLYVTIDSKTETAIEERTSINIFTLLHILLQTLILFFFFYTPSFEL